MILEGECMSDACPASIRFERVFNPETKQTESRLYSTQIIPKPKSEVFPFFAEAKNLERITPDFLNFKIVNVNPDGPIRLGTQITYKLKIHGVPLKWVTEIKDWQEGFQFVDHQNIGPYALWHHTHTFFDEGNGTTRMEDVVRFRLPLEPIGYWIAGWYVKWDVRRIFEYRAKVIGETFGGL